MIAGLLHACGLFLGPENKLLPPHETNQMGFFENEEFLSINERILAYFGGSWHTPPPLEGRWDTDPGLAPLADEARALIASFPRGLWGFKDPRTTILLPFWRRLVPGLRFVVCMRNPLEVARSLLHRDGIPVQRGAWLWEYYVTAALRGTEGASRCIAYFDDFFKTPRHAARRVVEFCGLPWPEDAKPVEAAIRLDLYQQRFGLEQLFEEDDLPSRAKVIYLTARAVCRDSVAAADGPSEIDDAEVGRLSKFLGFLKRVGEEGPLLRTERQLGEKMTALAGKERALAESVSRVSSLQEVIAQKDFFIHEIKTLNEKLLDDKERQLIAANDALSRKQTELEEVLCRQSRVLQENAQQLAQVKEGYESSFAEKERELQELWKVLTEKEDRFKAFEAESRDLILKKDVEIREHSTSLHALYKNEEKLKVEIDNLLQEVTSKEQIIKNIMDESTINFFRNLELENALREKENAANDVMQIISEKNKTLCKQNKLIYALSGKIGNQDAILRVKNQYCRNIEIELRSNIEIVKKLRETIEANDAQNIIKNDRLASVERELAEYRVKERSLKTQMENLSRLIRVMEADVDEKKRKIAECEMLMASHDNEYKNQIEKHEQLILSLETDVREKECKIVELEGLLETHTETLRNIFDSQSWKAVRFYGKVKGFFLS